MEDILTRAEGYRRQALNIGKAQYLESEKASKEHNWIGIPAVALSAVVGTSIFATISKQPHVAFIISAGLLSVAASVLAALQTFFNFSQKASMHKAAGARYGQLRREIDIFGLQCKHNGFPDPKDEIGELDILAKRLSKLESECPQVSEALIRAAEDILRAEGIFTRQAIIALPSDRGESHDGQLSPG